MVLVICYNFESSCHVSFNEWEALYGFNTRVPKTIITTMYSTHPHCGFRQSDELKSFILN